MFPGAGSETLRKLEFVKHEGNSAKLYLARLEARQEEAEEGHGADTSNSCGGMCGSPHPSLATGRTLGARLSLGSYTWKAPVEESPGWPQEVLPDLKELRSHHPMYSVLLQMPEAVANGGRDRLNCPIHPSFHCSL